MFISLTLIYTCIKPKEKLRNLIAYFLIGLINNVGYGAYAYMMAHTIGVDFLFFFVRDFFVLHFVICL